MVDVRYLAWAGYDLLGTSIGAGNIAAPPSMSSDSDGKIKVTIKELLPGLRGRMQLQNSPRVIQDDYRPFPGPTNE